MGRQPPSETNVVPYSCGVEIGRTYDLEIYVHCGVEWARFDGNMWQTERLSDGGNPPDGWGNPFHTGEMVMTDSESATFAGPDGRIEFTRTDRKATPVTDCM